MVKMRWIALFVLLSGVAELWAQTGAISGYCAQGATQAKTSGISSSNFLLGVIPSCTVTVRLTGTTTLATIYSDGSNTALSNSFTATTTGSWIFFATVNQGYDVTLSGGTTQNKFSYPVTVTALYPAAQFTILSANITNQINGFIPLATAASTIAARSHLDDGISTAGAITSTEPLRGTTATFTGNVSAVNGVFSGPVSGTTGTFSGAVSGQNGTFTGPLSATTGTFSGNVSGVNGIFSGPVSGTTGTFSSNLSSGAFNSSGNGVFSGSVSAASGIFSGPVSGTTGTFSGNVSGANGAFTGITATTGGFSGAVTGSTGSFATSVSSANGVFTANLTAQKYGNAVTPLTVDAACVAAQYWIAPITGALNKWRQCANGVVTDLGTGGGMVYPAAGIPNSSGAAWLSSYGIHGTATRVQLSDNTGVPNNLASYDVNGNSSDSGIAKTSVVTAYPAAGIASSTGSAWTTSYTTHGNTTRVQLSDNTGVPNNLSSYDANGNASDSGIAKTSALFGANVALILPGAAYSAGCTSANTISYSGVTTSSSFSTAFSTDPTLAVGWGAQGGLVLVLYPTANAINWKICNQTAATISSGSVTVNIGVR